MDQRIFKEWFEKHFVPQVENHLMSKNLPLKAVLLVDNAPSHPAENVMKSVDGNIVLKFLPPNVTPLIQPMDQGVIAATKKNYRSHLLERRINEGYDLKSFWKDFSILDSIYDIAAAWKSVKSSTLQKSWKKLMPSEENSNISVEEEALQDQSDVDCALALAQLARTVEGGEQVNDENINEWMNCDADDPGYELLSDEDIINKAQGVEEEIDNNEEEEMPPQSRVSHESALQHVERLIEYLEGEDFGTVADDLTLRKLRSQIRVKCHNKTKQKKLTDFFKAN